MSIETQLVPPEIKNLRILETNNIISFPDKVVFFSIINYELY